MRKLLAALCLFGLVTLAHADGPPLKINHQGRLLDAAMAPVSGMHTMKFAVYGMATGGAALWTESQTLAFDGGYYATTLGAVTPFAQSLFAGQTMYLGITVDDDAEMTPREPIDSVPYSMVASNATGDITPHSIAVNGTPIVDATGKWVGPSTGLVGPQGPQGPQGVGGVSMGFGLLTLNPPANTAGDRGPAAEGFDGNEKFYATKVARCMVHLNAWLWWRGIETNEVWDTAPSFRINIAPARSTQVGMLIGDGSPISLTPTDGTRQGSNTSWFWVYPGSVVSFGATARTMEGTVPSNASTMVYVHWICQYVEDDPNYAKNQDL